MNPTTQAYRAYYASPPIEVDCPYNSTHRHSRFTFHSHINQCKKDHPEVELVKCPYNDQHYCSPDNIKAHIRGCPDCPPWHQRPVYIDMELYKNRTFAYIDYLDRWSDDENDRSKARRKTLRRLLKNPDASSDCDLTDSCDDSPDEQTVELSRKLEKSLLSGHNNIRKNENTLPFSQQKLTRIKSSIFALYQYQKRENVQSNSNDELLRRLSATSDSEEDTDYSSDDYIGAAERPLQLFPHTI